MNNLAILGPNQLLNKSLRKNARRLVRETINRNWFREAYKVSNRHYTVTNTNGQLVGFALINKNHRNQKGDVRINMRFNIQRSPSHPSPKRPASSSASSARRSASLQKPHP